MPADETTPDAIWLVSQYQLGESVRALSQSTGLSRNRIRQVLAAANVPVLPRGRGRHRPTRQTPLTPETEARIRLLYTHAQLSRREVADRLGVKEHLVRAWMKRHGIRTRTRGRGNREDRRRVDPTEVTELYVESGCTADEVALKTGHTRHDVLASLHEEGLPVRVPNSGTTEDHVVLEELYDDALVLATLAEHGVPHVHAPGRLHERFPNPVPLSDALLRDLYVGCGLAVVHIELLTGHPSATLATRLRTAGVPARPPGGLSPFRRRHRARPRG